MPLTKLPNFDIQNDILIPKGIIGSYSSVNKFGRALDGIQTTATDIWDRADSTPTQQIWVAPTQARLHNIVSTSSNDDGDPVGSGARTVTIYGLTSWSSDETSETVTLNGVSNVSTSNSYVIIHRMVVATCGASGPNVGTITATAATDATVTAAILPGAGQTQMAIYGIPSTKVAYMSQYYFCIHESSVGATPTSIDLSLLINPFSSSQLIPFITKHILGVVSEGSSYLRHQFLPYLKITGPAIIKIQATSTVADTDASAGFDIFLNDV